MSADEVVIDLTGYKDRVGAHVPAGRYTVVVEDAELAKSKQQNQMINLWLRISGGDHDGATIIDRLTLTENAMFRVVAFMQALGIPTPKKRLQVNIRSWTGRALEIDVEDGEPYNGRVKSEVRGYARSAQTTTRKASSTPIDEGDDLPPAGTNGTADNPGVGGLAEFAPREPAMAGGVPTEVNLDDIDLG